ncbi:MAG: hypothetical protein HQL38_03745 [Alphaproteobacteria bacterium]|nr:hypothetical protein [Alphaproteobacteria bacterium]
MRIAAILLAAPLWAGSADAATRFDFLATDSFTDPGAPYPGQPVTGSLVLDDAAVAAGAFDLDDVVSFALSVGGQPADLRDTGSTILEAFGVVEDDRLVSGRLANFNPFFDFDMTGAAGVWEGLFITDDQTRDACAQTAFPCRFTGVWQAAAGPGLPLPSSAVLLLAGLALLRAGRPRPSRCRGTAATD